MESAARQTNGVAVRCDAAGIISEIIRDQIGVTSSAAVGQSFLVLLDPNCHGKARAFLAAVQQQNAVFNWELNAAVNDEIEPLHFAASKDGAGFIIVGAKTRSNVARIYDELAQINNEQNNALRAVLKEYARQTKTQFERDSFHYDELSKLNNELTTLQRELAKKNVELAQLNEQKNQFLGIASHDLRNPLEVIMTYSRFLLEDAAEKLDQEHVKFINVIRSSSEFMLNLVNDFLDYSKIEAGRLELNLETVDLKEIVIRTVQLNQVLAEPKNLHINFECDAKDLLLLRLDEAKIEQALNNLLGNAIKFSPANSAIEVRLQRSGENAFISVRDQGAGILQEDAENLFDPFTRGAAKATGNEKSTGLGLAIVKKIVEGHGGKISVSNADKGGAEFQIRLPL